MCTDCESNESKMTRGSPGYTGKFKKPTAMVSKSSSHLLLVHYGARKASEVVGRQKMPPMPKKRAPGVTIFFNY
jgi:hypothetical protein